MDLRVGQTARKVAIKNGRCESYDEQARLPKDQRKVHLLYVVGCLRDHVFPPLCDSSYRAEACIGCVADTRDFGAGEPRRVAGRRGG